MKTKRAAAKRIEVKEGNIVVPIYQFSDGRYCVDTMLGETRKRIARATSATFVVPIAHQNP